MNIAPVTEALAPYNKDFLSIRSFGSVPEAVAYSLSFTEAFEKNGVGTVSKHFPGNTNTDPHTGLPEISLTDFQLYKNCILPQMLIFTKHPSAVLMSHARTKAFDSKTPACMSSFWIQNILRTQMGFNGLVLSDDIFMGALAKNGYPPEKASVEAIKAGVDVIMLSEKKFADVVRVLLNESDSDADFAERLREAEKNVLRFKLSHGVLKLETDECGNYYIVNAVPESKEKRLEDFNRAFSDGKKIYERYFK